MGSYRLLAFVDASVCFLPIDLKVTIAYLSGLQILMMIGKSESNWQNVDICRACSLLCNFITSPKTAHYKTTLFVIPTQRSVVDGSKFCTALRQIQISIMGQFIWIIQCTYVRCLLYCEYVLWRQSIISIASNSRAPILLTPKVYWKGCVDTCHGTFSMTHARNVWVGGQMMTTMNDYEMVPISFNYHNAWSIFRRKNDKSNEVHGSRLLPG